MEKPKDLENFDRSPHIEVPGVNGTSFKVTMDKSWYSGFCNYYPSNLVRNLFLDLFQEIKHGDQEHQDWLENKIKDFISQRIK